MRARSQLGLRRFLRRSAATSVLVAVACSGPQSALEPGSDEAARIATLFWWMAVGSGVIWLVVVLLAVYAVRSVAEERRERAGRALIIYGGVVGPTLLLGVLLVYGLAMLPAQLAPAPQGSLRVHVTGEQWWWRVRYLPAVGQPFETANEIRMAVGQPVEFELESRDVIHSFWVPALGGKVDMIPGRKTRLRLHPTRTGIFRGACAEYCGTAHALMAFSVVVEEPAAFARWLETQAAPARAPADPLRAKGHDAFMRNGCGACHSVRGIAARGVVGPDLTHVGGRQSLAAGTLPNDVEGFRRWISASERVKPGVHMPGFGMLPDDELQSLAAYLDGLE